MRLIAFCREINTFLVAGLFDFAEIGGGDESGTEGTKAGELEEKTLAGGRARAGERARGRGGGRARAGERARARGGGGGGGDGGGVELDVKLTLVALLTDHLATETLELANDDLDLLTNLVLLLHDGHDVLRGAGGDDEV